MRPLRLRVDEPDVTLTDYLLAAETAFFARAVLRRPARPASLRRRIGLFFGAAAVASLAGGTVHGFFGDPSSFGHRVLWPTTLLAIGVSSFSLSAIAADLGFPAQRARRITTAATAATVGYVAVVLLLSQDFRVAIFAYVPAASFLLVVLARRFAQRREPAMLLGIASIALAFAAAGVQQAKIPLHPRYLDHNGLYHLIQALSFALFFRAARSLLPLEAAAG